MDTAKNKDLWQNMVSLVARKAVSDQQWLQTCHAVNLSVTFLFKRPKSHYRSGKNAMVLKGAAPNRHTQKPDLTKLVRCLEDALTGIIWNDDCQVVETSAQKKWAERDSAMALVRVLQ
jgi:Holliday junction resolvase RusA-like endonuclease